MPLEPAAHIIPTGAWVLIRTDWSNRRDPKQYLNVREDGRARPAIIRSP